MEDKEFKVVRTSQPYTYESLVRDWTPLDDMEFVKYLTFLESRFRRNITQFAGNEYNVRTLLIEPILKVLGWTAPLFRHSEVVCKRKEKGGRADFTLDIDGAPVIVIEAKSIDKRLEGDDEHHKENKDQLTDYINRTDKFKYNVVAGILTNGYEWRIYKYDNQELKCIIHTDISQHNDFLKVKGLFQRNDFKKDNIKNFSDCIKDDNCETFYEPKSYAKFRIISDKGREIKGKNNVETLKNFIIEIENKVIEMSKMGHFDKIIITKDNEYFQRIISTQNSTHDHGDYYITKDHGNDFKYLVIKQMIYLLPELKGWKVEYIE